jgi:hypothetical protein
MAITMPQRGPTDGAFSVRRVGDDIHIAVTQGDSTTEVEMSEYNAWRVFGCLALMLHIPLPKRVASAIRLSEDGDPPPAMTVGFPEPKTLGDRVAQHLLARRLEEADGFCNDED